jgi:hypothetical protein
MMQGPITTIAAVALAALFTTCTRPEATNTGSAAPARAEATEHSHAATGADSIGRSTQLTVGGAVEHALTLTVDSLRRMNVATINNFAVVCQSGATTKQDSTAKGVLLREILDKAQIKQNGHKDRNFYIVAKATDGYKATFSWAELFNNPTGDNVYVLFEENGRPIVEKGDMVLICRNDIKTGPRHVYWLNAIEVHRVD